MNILKKFLLFSVILTGSFVTLGGPNSAHALFESAKEDACRGANLSGNSDCDKAGAADKIGTTVKAILNILSVLVGIIAVISIIIYGLRFVTSGGDSNSVGSAKNGIIYAVVGLIIVALAQVIVRFVLSKI